MRKLHKALLSTLCCAAILLAYCNQFVSFAAEYSPEDATAATPLVIECTEIPLYMGEDYIGSGFMVESVTYVPLLTFTEHALGEVCAVEWDQETGTATLVSESLSLSLTVNHSYMVANGRCIWLEGGVYNVNGTLIVPIRALARVFGLELHWDEEIWAIHIEDSGQGLIPSGEEFYDEEELFWLSHVIYSEAGNQSLEGMIGVGNVVQNRLNDETGIFGSTLTEVIFQPGQFDVVATGTIYLEPSEEAVTAAKLCLEGCNTVGDSKYFVYSYIGVDPWWWTLTFVCRIGEHDFYA